MEKCFSLYSQKKRTWTLKKMYFLRPKRVCVLGVESKDNEPQPMFTER